jgi:hypothetical protein
VRCDVWFRWERESVGCVRIIARRSTKVSWWGESHSQMTSASIRFFSSASSASSSSADLTISTSPSSLHAPDADADALPLRLDRRCLTSAAMRYILQNSGRLTPVRV